MSTNPLVIWPELHGMIRNDISQLVIGRRYILETHEPRGYVRVGAFQGWALTDDQTGDFVKMVDELPEGWDEIYPECVFEQAIVADHYMVTVWEDDLE